MEVVQTPTMVRGCCSIQAALASTRRRFAELLLPAPPPVALGGGCVCRRRGARGPCRLPAAHEPAAGRDDGAAHAGGSRHSGPLPPLPPSGAFKRVGEHIPSRRLVCPLLPPWWSRCVNNTQTQPPRRESLARATALYLERKATSEAGTPTGDGPCSAAAAGAEGAADRSPAGSKGRAGALHRSQSSGGALGSTAGVGIRSLPSRLFGGGRGASASTGASGSSSPVIAAAAAAQDKGRVAAAAASPIRKLLFRNRSESGWGRADDASQGSQQQQPCGDTGSEVRASPLTPPRPPSSSQPDDDWQPLTAPRRASGSGRTSAQAQHQGSQASSRAALFHSPQPSRTSSMRRGGEGSSSNGALKQQQRPQTAGTAGFDDAADAAVAAAMVRAAVTPPRLSRAPDAGAGSTRRSSGGGGSVAGRRQQQQATTPEKAAAGSKGEPCW